MSIYDQARRYLLELARGQRVHGFTFILIGGWAIWHYNPYLESKDVDLVIRREEYWRLKELLRALGFTETRGRLAKKGFTIKTPEGGIDVDIYDDKIGPIEAESIFQGRLWQVIKMGGEEIHVASPTILLITKLIAAVLESEFITAPAASTLAASVTSALASIPSSLDLSAFGISPCALVVASRSVLSSGVARSSNLVLEAFSETISQPVLCAINCTYCPALVKV